MCSSCHNFVYCARRWNLLQKESRWNWSKRPGVEQRVLRLGERWIFTVVSQEPQIRSRSPPGTRISWVHVLLICDKTQCFFKMFIWNTHFLVAHLLGHLSFIRRNNKIVHKRETLLILDCICINIIWKKKKLLTHFKMSCIFLLKYYYSSSRFGFTKFAFLFLVYDIYTMIR